MDILFKCATRLKRIHPIFDGRLNGVIRKLAITLPCLLICCTVVAGNVRAELFDSGSMNKQVTFDERVNRRSVVVPVILGEVYLPESWSESSAQLGAGGNKGVTFGKQPGEPIANKRAYERAKDGECTADKGDFVSTDVHWQFLLAMVTAGFFGMLVALLIIAAVFHFAFGLPLPFVEKPNK